MSFSVNRLDVAFLQRSTNNQLYEQVNISGSNLIFYLDENGILTADKIANVLKSEGKVSDSIAGGVGGVHGSGYTPSPAPPPPPPSIGQTLYGVDTLTVGIPNRLSKYFCEYQGATYSYKLIQTETNTIDTPYGIGIGKPENENVVNATLDVSGTVIITGSLTVTGTIYGTIESSSYALTASYALNGGGGGGGATLQTGSFYPITSSWALTASYASSSTIPFNGNRTIKRSPYTALNVGGTTVDEFLENFFFPFVPATVAISSGGTSYYEIGTLQNFTIASTITANDEILYGTASVKRNSVDWNIVGSIPPLTFTYIDSNISTNYSYITFVQTDNDGSPTLISSNTKTATFIYPYLWGMSTIAGLSGNTLYTTLTKQVVSQGNKTVSLIGNVVYIYFCYPDSYAALSSILDPNGFEAKGNFDYSSSVQVASSGLTNDWTTNYRVYRTTLVSNPNGSYQFKY